MSHPLFALSPPPASGWHHLLPASWPSAARYWLHRPGPLTNGLRSLGRVDLRVARETMACLGPDERWMLAPWPAAPIVWLREVVMAIEGRDCVFARSFTPLPASHGHWHRMRYLRTRPLADMLYDNPSIVRSPFYVCRPRPGQPIHRAARQALAQPAPAAGTWFARGSTFWRDDLPLVVLECFLPAFWEHRARP